jgi:DNA-binding response OmpR family regulator
MQPAQSQTKVNLEGANALLLEQSQHGLDVLMQMLLGFGLRNCQKSTTLDDAVALAERQTLDLAIVDPALKDADGLEFVQWLRRCGGDPNRSIPIFVTCANGSRACVERARDAGASYFIVKPLTPAVLLDRILRVARDGRSFVVCDVYAGPDRRFKHEGPPPGMAPRRSTDVKTRLGEAVEPNLSQAEIDSFLTPQKVIL